MSVTAKAQRKEKVIKEAVSKAPQKMKKTAAKQEVIPKSKDGHKPDTTQFDSEYNPMKVENAWYSWWENQNFFEPKAADKKFVMILPPPNVTGELHLGHALTASIEDAITRYHRMCGEESLWVPGTDHAGIATQFRVEKKIYDEKKLHRGEYSREYFLEEAHKWVESKSGTILSQLRDMGSSLAWKDTYYTLDEKRSESVIAAFIKLFDESLIYRSERLVNWDCALKTAISDAEVEYITLTKRTKLNVPNHKYPQYPFGVMTHFYYEICDKDGKKTGEKVEIATTRLETMLGDTAVAINPKDARYNHLHGMYVWHPIREVPIPIIQDEILVDMNFGTGVVKVTPGHDPNDYEVYKRHPEIGLISILTPDGAIAPGYGQFSGMMRFDARVEMVKWMKERGLYKEEKDHEMRLGITQRGHDIVEQVITPQWFVNTTDMAARAIKAVDDGELKIVPDEFVVDWKKWHENIRPWCISRQLMWGHRIPAYRVQIDGKWAEGNGEWVAAASQEEAIAKGAKANNVVPSRVTVEQDPDVLDTWFSSALLPFSGVGWPSNEERLNRYFPNSILETGWDILTFWVSRMVMMSLTLTNKVPFHTILLHPLVRDAQGRKMSKSLGNVIDPRHVINGIELEDLVAEIENSTFDDKEKKIAIDGRKADFPNGIPQCGTDAMRLALCSFAGANRTANLNVSVIVSYRNFCNKMWNAVRFALPNFDKFNPEDSHKDLDASKTTPLDKWALKKLSLAIKAATAGLEDFKMADAVNGMTHFFHDEFCSVYLEGTKPIVNGDDAAAKEVVAAVLYECIESTMRMLHPFMPYVTEELWQHLPRRFNVESIMLAPYPLVNEEWLNYDVSIVDTAFATASAARSIKKQYNINNNNLEAIIVTSQDEIKPTIPFISAIGGLGKVDVVAPGTQIAAGYASSVVTETVELRINLKGVVDFEKELERLEKKLGPLQQQFQKYEEKISNPNYATKVKPEVQELERSKMEALKVQIEAINKNIQEVKQLIA
ncbi:valyl-tRNA synthetases family [Trichomonas vaginalis G3]|nr:valyl-tRNA synthetases family [Trichomonas vaginalis G3]KAI5521459.1 valyl-tRNA synthetases family [Trichomonas vaginalis G3]